MILDEKITIFISNKTILNKYLEKGYDCKLKEYLEIYIKDLPINSHLKIRVKCFNCGKEKYVVYQSYNKSTINSEFYCGNIECSKIKRNKSVLEKHGVENVFQLESTKEKIIETNIKNFGCKNPQQNIIIKEKTEQTNIKLYGFKNVFQNENIKEKSCETCFLKFGVRYYSQTSEHKLKTIRTNINRFGVEWYSQTNNFCKKQFLTKKFKNIYYQGSYELDFLEKYSNIFNIGRGPSIQYNLNNKKHIYHSDFYIKELDLIIEIKSSYWYNVHLEKCLAKEEYAKKEHNYLLILDKNYELLNEKILFRGF